MAYLSYGSTTSLKIQQQQKPSPLCCTCHFFSNTDAVKQYSKAFQDNHNVIFVHSNCRGFGDPLGEAAHRLVFKDAQWIPLSCLPRIRYTLGWSNEVSSCCVQWKIEGERDEYSAFASLPLSCFPSRAVMVISAFYRENQRERDEPSSRE